MADEPGPSKRVKYNKREERLTDEELLALLEESESENDPFENSSDEDPDYSTENEVSESEDEDLPSFPKVLPPPPAPVNSPPPSLPNIQGKSMDFWTFAEVPSQKFSFTKTPGLLVNVNSNEPIDYFNIMAPDVFFDMLCSRANNHAIDLISLGRGDEARITRWVDVTPKEMRTFLGLLFHMGTIKINRMNDYWKKNYLFNLTCFSSFMSRNRFLLILRSLQFENTDSNEPRTQLGKIMPLINYYNNKMVEIYYPTNELSIDESMVLWRGRLKFRQYVKGKRHKFGIKLYVLCEPKGIPLKMLVYAGSADTELSGERHTEKVVLALMAEKLDNGHSLYMDNFYNSVKLAEELLTRKTYVTGTLRSNRKGNPQEIIKKKLKKGELVVQHNSQGICVVKWKDRREILAISSQYGGQLEKVTTQRGQEKLKPAMINKYNQFMAGVDHCDQMLSYYSCEHKTLIWYKKLAIHIFQMMLLTSFYLYKQGHPNNKKNLYDFRLSIIEKLLGPLPTEPLPKIRITHLPELCPKPDGENTRVKRRRCAVCWEQKKQRKDSIYYCPLCPNQPGLCLTPCFRVFHSTK
ncbi:piggyBac transposable element-derived protein 4-like [Anthonomus grandis grandis]|uniref:piggyBac transposable element-derived protein 4-like n=2 Tax=Anthonomus grandis grandis TaxID=2921223 RepID=UPI002166BF6B|nr:piggyBac transposable element-derived protein 4-like [Anthonomus grandis grandis]